MAHYVHKLLPGMLTKLSWSSRVSCLVTSSVPTRYISCSHLYQGHDDLLVTKTPDSRYVCQQARCSLYQPVRYAGHSHWHNIRHIKGAMDKIRAKHNIRITQKIRTALKGKSLYSI